ncbi:MAG TPA: hypothetical protein VH722_06115 [Alphaproteobacteria bacterium]|nr:hypothetical protein [Alphaproteobacteria bacterium]
MESGKFIIAVILSLILAGGAYYVNAKDIDELKGQVAALQKQLAPIQTNAVNAGALANAAKAAADAAAKQAATANDAVTQLNQTVADMQKPAPATKKK